jgi:DNA-directed RNA polymerase specialized sigma24 family protein
MAEMHAEVCLLHDEIQCYLAQEFYLLSENIVRYAKFAIDPDDAVQECVCVCFEKIDRFDPLKGKAFNYLTTCLMNSLRQHYRTARNYNELRKKYYDHQLCQHGKQVIRNGREITQIDGSAS